MQETEYENVQTDDEDQGEILFGEEEHHNDHDDDDINVRSQRAAYTKSIEDLDEYFTHLYSYHQQKGYYPMIVGKLASLFRTFFMVGFSTFFIAYLKWETMYICANQTLCEYELGPDEWDQFDSYVRPLSLPPVPALIVTVFVLVFALYWLFDLLNFVFRQYWWIRYMSQVYEYELKIPEHELRVMSWNQVVERYQEVHESGRYQVERRNEPSTAHEIAMRIMRKDNYFVYLVDQDMFRFEVCACCCCDASRWRDFDVGAGSSRSRSRSSSRNSSRSSSRSSGSRRRRRSHSSTSSASTTSCCSFTSWCSCCSWTSLVTACGEQFTWTAFLSPFLSHSLRWLITDELIQHKNQFRLDRQEFAHSAARLRRRSRCLALAVFIGMPFILMFQIVYFFLRYAQEFSSGSTGGGKSSSSGGSPGTNSKFTPYWTWVFREYNELPHVFERRVSLSIKPAQQYLSQFHNPLTVVIARSVYFVAGSFIALLLVMSLLGDNVMLYIKFHDRNLLWYLSAFGAVAAICRSFIPSGTPAASTGAGRYVGNFQATTSGLLRQVITYTHYRPNEWSRKEHMLQTRNAVSKQLKTQIMCTLLELRSTLYLPWILAFQLPAQSENIVERIEKGTATAPRFSSNPRDSSIGDVCRPALFLCEDRQQGEDLSRSACNNISSQGRGAHVETKQGGREGASNEMRSIHQQHRAFRYHSSNKKIEKSLLSFRSQHPGWAATKPADNQTDQRLSESHTGNDLIARLAEFQNEQIGGQQQDASLQSMNASTGSLGGAGTGTGTGTGGLVGNSILNRVQQDLTASRILSSSGATIDATRSAIDPAEVAATLQSANARVSGSDFFTTNHMVDLPLDHPMTVGMYPSGEPQFFWLDKFYEAQNTNDVIK